MNILKKIYCSRTNGKGSKEVITVFYSKFPYKTGVEKIEFSNENGRPACEMFTRRAAQKFTLFGRGFTLNFKNKRSLKLYYMPGREPAQVQTLATVANECGLSRLKVVEFYSSMVSDIKVTGLKKAV